VIAALTLALVASLPTYGNVPDFTLTDAAGKPYSATQLDGHVTVLDFIFTTCPEVCPRMTSEMKRLQTWIVERGVAVKLVSVSVDPARDTPAKLAAYAKQFDAQPGLWTFATGSQQTIEDAVVRGFKIAVQKSDDDTDAFGIVHGTRFVLVDGKRQIRGYYDPNDAESMHKLQSDAVALLGGNEELGSRLAMLNAILNGTSALLLLCGFVAIRKKRVDIHWRCMVGAFTVSCLFLVSYIVRVLVSGTHRYPGGGIGKVVYLAVLTSHMFLAMAVPPLALRTLYLALKKRFAEHRRIVRFTWPIWMYVSVTGVVVYLMLYH
jgi:protein SCO1